MKMLVLCKKGMNKYKARRGIYKEAQQPLFRLAKMLTNRYIWWHSQRVKLTRAMTVDSVKRKPLLLDE